MAVLAVLGVAAPSLASATTRCSPGLYLAGESSTLAGNPISRFQITNGPAPRLRLYGEGYLGGCEGSILRFGRRHLTARLGSCLVDEGTPPSSCWCSPAVVRLSFPSDCARVRGAVRKQGKRYPLIAEPGRCGDGFVDDLRGEECDGDQRPFCFSPSGGCCTVVDGCDAECRCIATAPGNLDGITAEW